MQMTCYIFTSEEDDAMLNGFDSKPAAKVVDMTAYRHLMGLVKNDNHVAVGLFLDDREDVVTLLGAKPFGCGLIDEAVSGSMRCQLQSYLPESRSESIADLRPDVHGTWALHNAL